MPNEERKRRAREAAEALRDHLEQLYG